MLSKRMPLVPSVDPSSNRYTRTSMGTDAFDEFDKDNVRLNDLSAPIPVDTDAVSSWFAGAYPSAPENTANNTLVAVGLTVPYNCPQIERVCRPMATPG